MGRARNAEPAVIMHARPLAVHLCLMRRRGRVTGVWRWGGAALLGAATTVLVAVGGSVAFRHDEVHLRAARGFPQDTCAWSPGGVWRSWTLNLVGSEIDAAPNRSARACFEQAIARTYSDGIPPPYHPPAPPIRAWRFYEAGWPCTAFWGWVRRDITHAGTQEQRSGLVTLPRLRSLSGQVTTVDVPYRPLWGGLLVDTGLFGACWLAMIATPGAVRRLVRRRRGRCPACGYDRTGLEAQVACPECGGEE